MRAQRVVLQRLELVEDRCDEGRVDQQDEHLERDPDDPGPQPPQAAGLVHQPQHDEQQRQAERSAEQGIFQHVGEEQPLRHPVEAEPLFDSELTVILERDVDDARDHEHGGDERDLLPVAAADPAGEQRVECADAAEQRKADQHGRADDDFQHRQPGALDRIVGRALVGGQRDGCAELRGDAVAVRRNEADLPRREPQLGDDHREHGEREQQGERKG